MSSSDHPTLTTTTIVLGEQFKVNRLLHGNLVGLEGVAFGRRFLLGGSRVSIGRDLACSIALDDSGVSRHHAEIERVDTRFILRDRGSKNGTFVRGERITERELTDGDLVRIGGSVFKYLRLNQVELRYHDQVARLTNTDGLTGVYNRRHAWETIEQHLSRVARQGGELSAILFDVDHFKKLNDTYGHAAGDAALVELVKRVQAQTRHENVVARIGGEEFLVVLPDTGLAQAAETAERIRCSVSAHPFDLHVGEPVPVTISLGVSDLAELHSACDGCAEAAQGASGVDQLVALADAKLYEAKHGGRDRVCV